MRKGSVRLPALALGATALGATAFGAAALGAVAIGALAVRRLAIGKARIRSLEIDELSVHNLRDTRRGGSAGRGWEREGDGGGNAMQELRPTIARIWRGRTRREVADEYEAYNHETGIKPLMEKALGVQNLREDRETETEFITISYWESIEAMSRFAGDDPTRIHHLPRDAEFLIELPKSVQVLRILTSHGTTGR
jgi:heme-degrading monooxygenase HmoA